MRMKEIGYLITLFVANQRFRADSISNIISFNLIIKSILMAFIQSPLYSNLKIPSYLQKYFAN